MLKRGLLVSLFIVLWSTISSAVGILDVSVQKCDYDTLQTYDGSASFETIWNLNTYTLTYHLDGGVVDVENPETFTFETPSFTLTNPTKENFAFAGWCENSVDCDNRILEYTITEGSTESRDLYAVWEKQITIHFDSNTSGSTFNIPSDLVCVKGQDCLHSFSSDSIVQREHYSLDNWNLFADGSSDTKFVYQTTEEQELLIDFSEFINGTEENQITLYAQWLPDKKECAPGTFMQANEFECITCLRDNYCPGGLLEFSETNPVGLNACESGYSEPGAKSASECCAAGFAYDEEQDSCVSICEDSEIWNNESGQCESRCLESEQWIDNECRPLCGQGEVWEQGFGCHEECNEQLHWNGSACVCDGEQVFDGDVCHTPCETGKTWNTETKECVSSEFVCVSNKYLNIGTGNNNEKMCLSAQQKTHPALAVQVGNDVYYLNASTSSEPKPMTNGSTKKLKMLLNGVEYYIYDDSVE